jgi:hypothetical protein
MTDSRQVGYNVVLADKADDERYLGYGHECDPLIKLIHLQSIGCKGW